MAEGKDTQVNCNIKKIFHPSSLFFLKNGVADNMFYMLIIVASYRFTLSKLLEGHFTNFP